MGHHHHYYDDDGHYHHHWIADLPTEILDKQRRQTLFFFSKNDNHAVEFPNNGFCSYIESNRKDVLSVINGGYSQIQNDKMIQTKNFGWKSRSNWLIDLEKKWQTKVDWTKTLLQFVSVTI